MKLPYIKPKSLVVSLYTEGAYCEVPITGSKTQTSDDESGDSEADSYHHNIWEDEGFEGTIFE